MSKTRSEIKQDIKEAGGQYKGMSSKVDYLVAADPSSGSSKIKKADKYDIPVISEDELYSMM
jgi:NAD-dependent DNA ligase